MLVLAILTVRLRSFKLLGKTLRYLPQTLEAISQRLQVLFTSDLLQICDPLWEKVQFRGNNEFELGMFIGERVILLASTFYSLI